ncbi:MAG: hypothetical protein AMXMBFR84_26300 [Candidatus Hydrogenedentota bacterium]
MEAETIAHGWLHGLLDQKLRNANSRADSARDETRATERAMERMGSKIDDLEDEAMDAEVKIERCYALLDRICDYVELHVKGDKRLSELVADIRYETRVCTP